MKRAILLVALLLAQAASPSQASAASNTFSGRATVVDATVAGQQIVLADTGPLPSSGGALEASLLEADVPGTLSVQVLHAATVAQGDNSRAEASVADLALAVGGNSVTASFVRASAHAMCTGSKASVSGSSELVALTVNGQSTAVTGAVDQTVPLPGGGSVVINEQTTGTSASGSGGDITVTALHVIVPGVADVSISRAHADITCAGQATCDKDFITGGGWIMSSGRDTFALAGGIRDGAFWGHLEYIDHATGMKVHGTGVTGYTVTGTTSRHITGTAQVNGVSGFTYGVDVADNGEPGTNDTFSITLSNGYSAGGTLGGGNIQLHNCN
jgi:hypothetical protein